MLFFFEKKTTMSKDALIKEIVDTSYKIYEQLLLDTRISGPITLVCIGKSMYYGLAMTHLPFYDNALVSVEALPEDLSILDLRPMVYVIDIVRTGKTINSVASVLCRHGKQRQVRTISVNHPTFMPRTHIYMQFICPSAYSLGSFSDVDIDIDYNGYCEPIIAFAEKYPSSSLAIRYLDPCSF